MYLWGYRRADLAPANVDKVGPPCNPNLRRPKPNTTTASTILSNITAHSYFSTLVIHKQFYEIQVSSAAAAACLDVSLPIDHFPPDCGGNGFRRTTSDFFE